MAWLAAIGWSVGSYIFGEVYNELFGADAEDYAEPGIQYGWSELRTPVRSGIVVPVVLGTRKSAGVCIDHTLSDYSSDEARLHTIVALSEGPIYSIAPPTINDTAYTSYKGVVANTRLGTNNQLGLNREGDAQYIAQFSAGTTVLNLNTPSDSVSTSVSNVTGLRVVVQFEGYVTGSDRWARLKVEYGIGSFTDSATVDVCEMSQPYHLTVLDVHGLPAGTYQVRITFQPVPGEDVYPYVIRWRGLHYETALYAEYRYPNTALVQLNKLRADQVQGKMPTVAAIVNGLKCVAWDTGTDCFTARAQTKNPALQAYALLTDKRFGFGQFNDLRQDMTVAAGAGDFTVTETVSFDPATTVDGDSAAAQKVLAVAATTGFVAGQTVTIHYGGAREEHPIIASVSAGVSLTMVSNLEYAHTAAQADDVDVDGPHPQGEVTAWDSGNELLTVDVTIQGFESGMTIKGQTSGTSRAVASIDVLGFDMAELAAWESYCNEYVPTFDAHTTVDSDSASGQKILNVAATTDYTVGDLVVIGYRTARNETKYIASIQDGVSLTMSVNLTYTHTGAQADPVDTAEARHQFSYVWNQSERAVDALRKLTSASRGLIVWRGSEIGFRYDHDHDSAGAALTGGQMYTMGNMNVQSFTIKYASIDTRRNVLEVRFADEDSNYEDTTVRVEDPDIGSGELYRPGMISLGGVTRKGAAIREGLFRVRVNRKCRKRIEFGAALDAFSVSVGDLIWVSHDLPKWGQSGSCVSSTNNTVTLDRDVTLAGGTTYDIRIRHNADNTFETATITTGAGTTSTLSIAAATWTTNPSVYDLYAVYDQSTGLPLFRITELHYGPELDCVIRAVEYDTACYDDDFGMKADEVYTALPTPGAMLDDVTDLALVERVTFNEGGQPTSVILVGWNHAQLGTSHYEIWYSTIGVTGPWTLAETTNGNSGTIRGIAERGGGIGSTYYVSVVPVAILGTKKHPDDATQDSITLAGDVTGPDDVTGFTVIRIGANIRFSWAANTDEDIAGYEIRQGSVWGAASLIASISPGSATSLETEYATPGSVTFLIKARDTSGNYSANATSTTATLEGIINENVLIEQDEHNTWAGTKSNMTVTANELVMDSGQAAASYTLDQSGAGPASGERFEFTADLRSRVFVNLAYVATYTWAQATFTWASTTAQDATWDNQATAMGLAIAIEERHSTDSGGTFSDWTELIQGGEYVFDTMELRVSLTRTDTSGTVKLTTMSSTVDVPDVVDSGTETTDGANPSTVTFGKTFISTPNVIVSILDAAATGEYAKVSGISATQFTLNTYGAGDNLVAALVHWIARGY